MHGGAAFAADGVRDAGRREADDAGVDVEMTDGPVESGDYRDMVDVVGEGRSADVLREKGDVGVRWFLRRVYRV